MGAYGCIDVLPCRRMNLFFAEAKICLSELGFSWISGFSGKFKVSEEFQFFPEANSFSE